MKKIFRIGNKKIGTLENGVFTKEALKSKHLFRVLDAWGIDSQTLSWLPAGTSIVIHELEEKKTYRTTKETFVQNGEYYHFKNGRTDHQTQLFLRRSFFTIEEPKKLEGDELAKREYMRAMGLE